MKEIKLSQRNIKSKNRHLVALVDDEDFDRISQKKWTATKTGTQTYAVRKQRCGEKTKMIVMHKEVMGLNDTKIILDHKDRNGLNNMKSNLRVCTASENAINRPKAKMTQSKYIGVAPFYGKFMARICKNQKLIHIGTFENEDDAAIAYNECAKVLHGEFAQLNVIE